MGAVVGDLFGAGTDIYGGEQGSNLAMTGFNYLSGNPYEKAYIANGGNANNMVAQLLGAAPMQAGTKNAFDNYLNSSGYKFNLQQGDNAINSNQAARGLLNSGSTGKALTAYGQNLGSGYFNNYLNQLMGLSGAGQTAIGQVGQAGTTGGGNAGEILSGAFNNASNSMTDLGNFLGGLI